MSTLALLGGAPVLDQPLPPYRSIGEAERAAVLEVMDGGSISAFFGSPGDEYFGGPKVQAFEAVWRERWGVRHAITVNSATSGLIAAMGAIGLSPGDEVIVPPTTMSATVMAPLFYGGIPVFADIEDATFCIDPQAVAAAITPRTRAILAVNLFGHPARLAELRALADTHGLYLVEDNAQSPLGAENGRPTGTVGHIGVFSLNYHKHVHTGEGGVCVTDDDRLGTRLAMIRNHAENATEWLGMDDLSNMIGHNLRMSELHAAIGLAQVANIDSHVEKREAIGDGLTRRIQGLAGLTAPQVRSGCRHNYYTWTWKYDAATVGVSRATFSRALEAEGVPHAQAYIRPLYTLPAFRKRIAMGRDGFPFTLTERRYEDGLCPVAERLHAQEIMLFEPCAYAMTKADLDRIGEAFHKVHGQIDALRGLEAEASA